MQRTWNDKANRDQRGELRARRRMWKIDDDDISLDPKNRVKYF